MDKKEFKELKVGDKVTQKAYYLSNYLTQKTVLTIKKIITETASYAWIIFEEIEADLLFSENHNEFLIFGNYDITLLKEEGENLNGNLE